MAPFDCSDSIRQASDLSISGVVKIGLYSDHKSYQYQDIAVAYSVPKHTSTSLLAFSEPDRFDRSTRISTRQSPSKHSPKSSSQRRFLNSNSFLLAVGKAGIE